MTPSRDQKLVIYERLIAGVDDLETKGKKTAYTSMNGNMFSFLSPQGDLAFRLSSEERMVFLNRFPEAVVEQYGTVMKDYVAVPDALLADEAELQELFAQCVDNARALKAKPTTRKRKS